MRRALRFGLGVLVGVLVGAAAALTAGLTVPPVSSTIATPTTLAPATSLSPTLTEPLPASLLLVWTSGGLPDGLAAGVASLSGVSAVAQVNADLVALTDTRDLKGGLVGRPDEGMYFPVEVAAFDESMAEVVPVEWQGEVESLADGVLLTETSARVRRLGVGGTLTLEGDDLRVEGVLPDVVLGGAEVVVSVGTGERLGVETPRYLLVTFDGDRAQFESQVRELLPPGLPARVRAPGETPFLRHGDAVLPQAIIKDSFGEFAIREVGGGDLELDRAWREANLITDEVALLGQVTCHVGVMSALQSAMTELEQANLGFLVETFHGCWNPRFIGGARSISRHAWGVAVDINYQANVTGQTTTQDARLVETMERWGFTWGGNWLVPDAAHFEWVSPPLP